ncbi:MAG: response regulator [Planctomycetota bacterium]|jgi:CheY-like chemotaxis protein
MAISRSIPSTRVAIVDDDVESSLVLRDYLEGKGLSVECFADAEALLDGNPGRFDAILLDLNLPGIWGHECSYRLRRTGYAGLIVAISGNLELWSEHDLADFGFTCALGKPLNPSQLITLLNEGTTGAEEDRSIP